MEAELIALSNASDEANWLRSLLYDIPMWDKLVPPVLLHCDSTAAIGRVHSLYYNGKARSVRRIDGIVRGHLSNGAINFSHVRSEENIVDQLTKALAREKICKALRGMGLLAKDVTPQTQERRFSLSLRCHMR
ncbi:hypothetical protein RND81_01G098200 [Saponaria officinalis]|uniref:Uncharacterized protein n=1 Tax=Saponaria officinalis TaxID=3572 RepID=A0AAW1ND64_SAPOF